MILVDDGSTDRRSTSRASWGSRSSSTTATMGTAPTRRPATWRRCARARTSSSWCTPTTSTTRRSCRRSSSPGGPRGRRAGSRLKGGEAIAQGMPRWKYVSNRFLTWMENRAFGLDLSDTTPAIAPSAARWTAARRRGARRRRRRRLRPARLVAADRRAGDRPRPDQRPRADARADRASPSTSSSATSRSSRCAWCCPRWSRCAAPDADLVLMVKPQFEVGKERLGAAGWSAARRCGPRRCGRWRRSGRGPGPGRRGRDREPAAGSVGQRRVLPVAARRGAGTRPGGGRPGGGGGAAVDRDARQRRRPAADAGHGADRAPRSRTPGAGGHPQRAARRPAGCSAAASACGCSRRGARTCRCRPRSSCVDAGARGAPTGCELVIVLGGDGTLLRGAELARTSGRADARRQPRPGRLPGRGRAGRPRRGRRPRRRAAHYSVEERMTVDVDRPHRRRRRRTRDWALNEASVEKAAARADAGGRRSRSTAGRCPAGAATAWSARRRPARRPTPSPRAARWSGRRSRRC